MNRSIIKFYYPHGLKVVSAQTYNTFFTVKDLKDEYYVIRDLWDKETFVPYDSPEYMPVLYPLGCLNTQIKTWGGKYICPLDLIIEAMAKCSSVIVGEDRIWFREIIIKFFSNQAPAPFCHNPLKQAYNILYSLHFDLDNLIGMQEALDVTCLKWNPYEMEKIVI